MIIDADAHVVETVHTWDYLEGSDKKYRPQLFRSEDNPSTQYWFLDGKSIGFRNPTLSEQELLALSKETGRTLQTDADARELRDVELRLQHMDKLGIDVQSRNGSRPLRILESLDGGRLEAGQESPPLVLRRARDDDQ